MQKNKELSAPYTVQVISSLLHAVFTKLVASTNSTKIVIKTVVSGEISAFSVRILTLTPRRLRPISVANKTQTRDPLNFGPCKADWPAAFVIK